MTTEKVTCSSGTTLTAALRIWSFVSSASMVKQCARYLRIVGTNFGIICPMELYSPTIQINDARAVGTLIASKFRAKQTITYSKTKTKLAISQSNFPVGSKDLKIKSTLLKKTKRKKMTDRWTVTYKGEETVQILV